MLYLGIDVGKFSHSFCLLDSSSGHKQIWQFHNTKYGFMELKKKLDQHIAVSDYRKLIIGMEATGHYFLNIYEFFLTSGIDADNIALLNPLQVKSFRNTNLRGAKSDNIDAERIAALLHFGDYQKCNVPDNKLMNLRELTRLRAELVANIGNLKRKIISVMDRLFPEFAEIFSNKFGKTALSLMSEYPTPEEMAELSIDDLNKIIKKISKRGISERKIKLLHSSAKNSIGITFGQEAFKFELRMLLERLQVFQKQIDELENKIECIVSEFNSPIFSIPGIGKNTGAAIFAETGNVENFSSAVKLIAFAGLDPKLRESGNYQGKTPISKRGSKYLRNALWHSAMVACRVNPKFKEDYKKRRNEGKSHRYAVTAAANKLTKIVYHILKNNCSFDPELV
ncbi:MAG: IS110 family transposase [Patescibacteria group bacterium]|nr:IS110 family transposase [Patescibacteria group bacterium]